MTRNSRLFFVLVCSLTATGLANDWPYWRGPEQTGMSREKAVVTHWTEGGENLLWKVPVGGRSTPIVMDGRVFAITPVGEGACLQERVVCLDANTGKTIWEYRFNVFLTDIVENRVGWTALVGDPQSGYVYAHGTGGEFFCFDRDGKVLWKRSLGEEFGRYSGYGGRLHTPIIDEDRVVISIVYILSQWGTGPAKAGHRYYAFDKWTGEVVWASQPGGRPLDTTYSVPVVSVIGGRRMLAAGNADGNVYGMLSRTGEKAWTFRLSKRGLNTSVVVDGDYAYASHSEENLDGTEMGRLVCIDATGTGDITETGEVWRADGLKAGYSSLTVANGRVYIPENGGMMHCYDGKSGKEHWKYDLGRAMKGSPAVTADGVIYVGEVNGRFHILRDEGERCVSLDFKELSRPDGKVVEIQGSPAISDGRVYFMTRYDTYCLGTGGETGQRVTVPQMAAESGRFSPDGESQSFKPRLQLVPAEVTLAPGEGLVFKINLLDDGGRFVSEVGVGGLAEDSPTGPKWSVQGVAGSINIDGAFQAWAEDTYSAGTVTLAMTGVEAVARVRVSPELPINETFDELPVGDVPPGWIGVDAKTKLVERDGSVVLEKLAAKPSAPFSRMRAFSGKPIQGGCTVQADLLGTPKKGRRPTMSDMGLINTRYQLILLGAEKQLRLVTWAPIPRLQKEVPFDWKPDVWYRAKLRVEQKGERGWIRGKVWPRDSTEPEAWQVELLDPCPNLEGSPGLYGYSKGASPSKHGASIFYDNYRVTRND